MRVSIISHTCVVDVNQKQYVFLNALPDVEIELITPQTWRSDFTDELFESKVLPEVDFPVHRLPIYNPGHVWLHYYKSIDLPARQNFKPDIILSIQEPWSLSNLQAVRLATTLKIPYIFKTDQNILKRYPPPFSWFEQRSFRNAAAAFASSEPSRQVLVQKGMTKPTMVIPYGTDVSLFYPGISPLRAQWGIEENDIVIGYLGRLVPEKGLHTLVEAAKLLQSRHPNLPVKYLIVGSGPEMDSLQQAVADADMAGRWIFTGAVSHQEAGEYMRCLDIFVVPSLTTPKWKEQFGRVIIEAMATRIPVAGSSSGEIPNLIRETGGGAVFAEGNGEDLAQILTEWILDPEKRHTIGALGESKVRERYTMESVARQIYDILQMGLKSTPATANDRL